MPPTELPSPPSQEEIAWASKTAARLRLVQNDFADRPAEERHGFLDDELDAALREITMERRAGYLGALAEYFPTAIVAQQAVVESAPADNSPEALVEALIKVAPQLPKSLLAQFGLALQQAGYMEIKSTTLLDAPPEDVLRSIPLDPALPVDLQRLYRALAAFADFYIGLETILWRIWREIAPRSTFRREATDVKKLTARYLQGDREVAVEQLRQIIERTRMLTGGILGALPSGASEFMAKFTEEFSPEAVAAQARAERNTPGWTEDARNWNQYKKLFEARRGQPFEETLYDALAHKAESLMTGTAK